QISDWAFGNNANTQKLRKALQGGLDGLLQLSTEYAGITFDDIRRLHHAKYAVIYPLSNIIDDMELGRYNQNDEEGAYQLIIYPER
ncbi:hypothetical protein MPER_01120, partial [Moniliophthora perniciosa FA553]